ncbi:MAG: 4'-phosphopantetheinyl transferase superfamily protein [Pseudoclavibacter sp.]
MIKRRAADPDLRVSFSASGNRWLLGVSIGRDIGVDLEAACTDFTFSRRIAFTEREQSRMTVFSGARAADARSAAAAWVAKEAAAKASGLGLKQDLRALRWRPATPTGLEVSAPAGVRLVGVDGELFGTHRFAAVWEDGSVPHPTVPVWRRAPLGEAGDHVSAVRAHVVLTGARPAPAPAPALQPSLAPAAGATRSGSASVSPLAPTFSLKGTAR